MKRLMILTLTVLLAAAAIAAPPAPHQGGPGAPPPGAGPNGDAALADYLDLTAAQIESWKAIQSDVRTSVQSLLEQQRALHEQLRAALDGTDANAIGALMLQIRGIGDQIKAARDAADAKFSALLTTEQKSRFEAFQAAVEFLRQNGPGGGPPR